jgi:DNA-binding transcriptional MerR regulator
MAQDHLLSAAELADLFGVSTQTIRQWSIEFGQHLSPSANPGRNRVRAYDHEDLAVMALVAGMKEQGRFYQDIHAALANGQRGEPPDVETLQRRSRFEDQLTRLQTATDRELALANQRAEQALARVERLEQQIERAESDREFWRQQATASQEKLDTVSDELHSAHVEGARLSGEMEGLKRERDRLAQYREDYDQRLTTSDERYQAQMLRFETQVERLQARIDSLEDERNRLAQELMAIYRRLAAANLGEPTAAESADGGSPEGGT